jgi:PPOX class probable F420-dependent enzyme
MQLPDDVRALVDGPNFGHVATLRPDGSPHTVPVWLGRDGDRVLFLSSPSSAKARHLARDPRLAISVIDHERPFVMAQLRGRLTEVIDGDAGWAIIDRLSQQYLGQPYPLREDRVVYAVEVDHAQAIAYG